MKIAIYGLVITSSWGNGHATTYRSLCKALARRGHQIDFVEKDLEWYRNNRDLPTPEFCKVHQYEDWARDSRKLVRLAKDADVVVIGSYFPDGSAAAEALFESGCEPIVFYDIDTPITISKLRGNGCTTYLESRYIPFFAAYLSFTGGPLLREIEEKFRAPMAIPFYCSVDPELYRPTASVADFRCDMSYLGTYAHDRQAKLERLLNATATALPKSRFIVAGPQYPPNIPWEPNVERIIHLSPREHPAFYCSSRFTLNLTRAEMIAAGYSPSVRLFEAAACGATIVSDDWDGLESFLTPGEEILLPRDTDDVVRILQSLSDEERIRIGLNARERILSQHTAMHRALQFEGVVDLCRRRIPTKRRSKPETFSKGRQDARHKQIRTRELSLPQR